MDDRGSTLEPERQWDCDGNEEGGAKIQVYGTKAGIEQKAEIKPSDGSEIQGVASKPPPPNISTANMVSCINHPIAAPSFTFIPRPQVGLPYTYLSTSLQARVPSSVSGSVPSFAPLKPSMTTASSPGVLTFQPHGPQNPSFQTVPQLSSHFSAQNASLARPMLPPPAPQAPSVQFPQPGSQVLLRPQLGDNMGQHPSAYMSTAPYARNSTAISVPPRLATFIDSSTVLPRTPVTNETG